LRKLGYAYHKHLAISFFIRKDKLDSKSKVPIYMPITVNGDRTELSTHRKVEPRRWNNVESKLSKILYIEYIIYI
ncbi:MAG: Arm DNA-binding domain-containing protein, partial [Bacteroidales bacterium]|nr:Arm DNA-binding domain-containing protein [Bacteroidales bacterium]